MASKTIQFFTWMGRFVQEPRTNAPSVKRYGLALAVTVLCGVMLGFGFGITVALVKSDPAQSIEMVRIVTNCLALLAGLVLTAVTTGYLVGRATESKEGKDPNDD